LAVMGWLVWAVDMREPSGNPTFRATAGNSFRAAATAQKWRTTTSGDPLRYKMANDKRPLQHYFARTAIPKRIHRQEVVLTKPERQL